MIKISDIDPPKPLIFPLAYIHQKDTSIIVLFLSRNYGYRLAEGRVTTTILEKWVPCHEASTWKPINITVSHE